MFTWQKNNIGLLWEESEKWRQDGRGGRLSKGGGATEQWKRSERESWEWEDSVLKKERESTHVVRLVYTDKIFLSSIQKMSAAVGAKSVH